MPIPRPDIAFDRCINHNFRDKTKLHVYILNCYIDTT